MADPESRAQRMREMVGDLPEVNRATLECVTALLRDVSRKSSFNKVCASGRMCGAGTRVVRFLCVELFSIENIRFESFH